MAVLRARVEPEILHWARKTRGFTIEEAAKAIRVKPQRIQEWEDGLRSPTVKQLRQIAHAYRRSIGLLFLPERPEEDEIEAIRDFRRLPGVEAEDLSPALRLEIRLATERRIEAIELAAALGEDLPSFDLTAGFQDDPAEIGAKTRETLGISPLDQFSWSNDYDAFHSWRAALERLGVLVFQTGGLPAYKVSRTEVRGFSIAEHPLPVVVLNSSDGIRARCFTLLHELAHIALRSGGLCDLHDSGIEAYCNKVAAATLVPANALVAVLDAERYPRSRKEWEDGELRTLANRFKVSWEVMLLRLLALGRTTQQFYDEWKRTHPPKETEGGFLLPHRRAVMRNGRLFPRLAFDAHSRGYLSLNELSTLLGENVKHVDRVARNVFDPRYMS